MLAALSARLIALPLTVVIMALLRVYPMAATRAAPPAGRSAPRHVMSALFLMAHAVSRDHVTHPLLAFAAERIPILADVLLG